MSKLLDWIEAQNLEGKALALLLLVVAALLASLLISQCAGPRESPIGPALQGEITAHELFRPHADLLITTALQTAADEKARADSAIRIANTFKAKAKTQGQRADSLAGLAAASRTARDSATHYQQAYDARTAEVASLTDAIANDSIALAKERDRGDRLQRALVFSDSLRHVGDSLLTKVVSAVKSSGCTIPGTFDRVDCPSRTTAFWTGVGLAVVTAVVVTHRDDLAWRRR